MAPPIVAIIGATGAVGLEILRCLEQRNFPLSELRLFASSRSQNKKVVFRGQTLTIQELSKENLRNVRIAFFSAGSEISRQYAPLVVEQGAIVIDNSSAFRMDPNTPLIIPEINPQKVIKYAGIIANPNCSTIIGITPLWPIHQKKTYLSFNCRYLSSCIWRR